MQDMNETTFLQEGNVKVTDRRLLIGTAAYGISNIRSVQLIRQGKNKRPLRWIAFGILLSLGGTIPGVASAEFYGIGALIVIVSSLVFLLVKPPYTIQIETPSNKFGVLNTADISLTKRIINAMNQAIARNRKS